MAFSRDMRGGRGWVRGLFLSAAIVAAVACDKRPDKPESNAQSQPDVGAQAAASTDARLDIDADATSGQAATPPQPFDPPWTELAPSWNEVASAVADQEIGKMSGEAWGTDAVVRGVVRSQCGSGALIQVVFEGEQGLRVSPAMPVRFIGLATGQPVTYREGNFEVTLNFERDDAERLAGSLKIAYEEHGQDKTFIDLVVDGKPMPMLLEPKLDGEGRLPEFHACHPSGRFYARTTDGRQASGYVYGARSEDGQRIVIVPLLTANTGLRVVAFSRDVLGEPWTVDLSKDVSDAPVQVGITAFYTPELTAPETARGPNIGNEQTVTVRRGSVEVGWAKRKKNPFVTLKLRDVQIPELIAGPLRGITFEEFVIEVEGYPHGIYPEPPVAEPLRPAASD